MIQTPRGPGRMVGPHFCVATFSSSHVGHPPVRQMPEKQQSLDFFRHVNKRRTVVT